MFRSSLLLVLIASLCSYCASGPHQILVGTENYNILISKVSLGPNEYYEGNEVFEPKSDGERFVWVTFSLTPHATFRLDYNAIQLKAGEKVTGPMRILQIDGLNKKPVQSREALKAGVSVYREAIYILPSDEKPSELILPGSVPVAIPGSLIFNYGG